MRGDLKPTFLAELVELSGIVATLFAAIGWEALGDARHNPPQQ